MAAHRAGRDCAGSGGCASAPKAGRGSRDRAARTRAVALAPAPCSLPTRRVWAVVTVRTNDAGGLYSWVDMAGARCRCVGVDLDVGRWSKMPPRRVWGADGAVVLIRTSALSHGTARVTRENGQTSANLTVASCRCFLRYEIGSRPLGITTLDPFFQID